MQDGHAALVVPAHTLGRVLDQVSARPVRPAVSCQVNGRGVKDVAVLIRRHAAGGGRLDPPCSPAFHACGLGHRAAARIGNLKTEREHVPYSYNSRGIFPNALGT